MCCVSDDTKVKGYALVFLLGTTCGALLARDVGPGLGFTPEAPTALAFVQPTDLFDEENYLREGGLATAKDETMLASHSEAGPDTSLRGADQIFAEIGPAARSRRIRDLSADPETVTASDDNAAVRNIGDPYIDPEALETHSTNTVGRNAGNPLLDPEVIEDFNSDLVSTNFGNVDLDPEVISSFTDPNGSGPRNIGNELLSPDDL